jgi:hypothetical protein|tara:strand:+ start:576 stop:887 length:312 start_codon:yes stop_codon:yes gene_type:complete
MTHHQKVRRISTGKTVETPTSNRMADMKKSYVQTLMEVEKVFGQINDHDYRLYRAVWGNRQAAQTGLPRGTRAEISKKLANDFVAAATPATRTAPGTSVPHAA